MTALKSQKKIKYNLVEINQLNNNDDAKKHEEEKETFDKLRDKELRYVSKLGTHISIRKTVIMQMDDDDDDDDDHHHYHPQ